MLPYFSVAGMSDVVPKPRLAPKSKYDNHIEVIRTTGDLYIHAIPPRLARPTVATVSGVTSTPVDTQKAREDL